MPPTALDDRVQVGSLKAEVASARLADARNSSLCAESRFDLADNAPHALALAALRLYGYRSEHRYRVSQCLQPTVELPNEQWRVLGQAHRKRNLAQYAGEVEVDAA